jgi:membrane fusion protein, copper/silver efflux system
MKFLFVLVGLGLIFVFGVGYGRWYSTRPAAAKDARKILYYVDPMHPWYKSDKPGIAPDCGMKLEPVYAGEAAPTSEAAAPSPDMMLIAQDKQQLIGLKYGQAEWMTEGQPIHASGRVAVDETRVSRVHSKVEGWIEHVSADFTGQMVQKGQPLLTLYSPEMLASQQELLLALKARTLMSHSSLAEAAGNSESLVEAARRRLELWDLKGEQIAEVERTGKPVKSIPLYSPASGFLTARNAFPGQKIMPETELYAITDLSRVWVMADVSESDAPQVRMGQSARITLPGGAALTARVAYLQPQIDPTTRTLKVRLDVANGAMRLRPDEFVEVGMQIGAARRLMVPADAVLDSGTAKTIFLDKGNGYFEPRQVETGQRIGDRVEIVKGLTAEERIVTSGAFLLNSESQMKATEKRR